MNEEEKTQLKNKLLKILIDSLFTRNTLIGTINTLEKDGKIIFVSNDETLLRNIGDELFNDDRLQYEIGVLRMIENDE